MFCKKEFHNNFIFEKQNKLIKNVFLNNKIFQFKTDRCHCYEYCLTYRII